MTHQEGDSSRWVFCKYMGRQVVLQQSTATDREHYYMTTSQQHDVQVVLVDSHRTGCVGDTSMEKLGCVAPAHTVAEVGGDT